MPAGLLRVLLVLRWLVGRGREWVDWEGLSVRGSMGMLVPLVPTARELPTLLL